MGIKTQITEYLDIDLEKEVWCCNRCGKELISARENYKKGCSIYARDPRDIYRLVVEGGEYSHCPDPTWMALVECYCPECGVLVDVEALPLGHPMTHDIELDIDKLKQKYLGRKGKSNEDR